VNEERTPTFRNNNDLRTQAPLTMGPG
jgi:hypothetical protein